MSMISEQVDQLRRAADIFDAKNARWLGKILQEAADTIEMLSEKARPQILCKDCIYRYEAQYGFNHKWCDRVDGAAFAVDDDGFCAWGKRKEQSDDE